jgi:hypothetical protein
MFKINILHNLSLRKGVEPKLELHNFAILETHKNELVLALIPHPFAYFVTMAKKVPIIYFAQYMPKDRVGAEAGATLFLHVGAASKGCGCSSSSCYDPYPKAYIEQNSKISTF